MPQDKTLKPLEWEKEEGKDSIQGSKVIRAPQQSKLGIDLSRITNKQDPQLTTETIRRSTKTQISTELTWNNIKGKPTYFRPETHGNEAHGLNIVVKRTSDPPSPQEGDFWYQGGRLRYKDNIQIREILDSRDRTTSTPQPVGSTPAAGVSSELARADHKHEGVYAVNNIKGSVDIVAGNNVIVETTGNQIKIHSISSGGGGGNGAPVSEAQAINIITDVTAGQRYIMQLPYPITLTGWKLYSIGDNPGNVTASFNLKRSNYTDYPTWQDIVGSGTKPHLTNAVKNSGTTSNWSIPSLNTGDLLSVACENTASAKVLLVLEILTRYYIQKAQSIITVADSAIGTLISGGGNLLSATVTSAISVTDARQLQGSLGKMSGIAVVDSVIATLQQAQPGNPLIPSSYAVYNHNNQQISADLSVWWDNNTSTTYTIFYSPPAPQNPRWVWLYYNTLKSLNTISVYITSYTSGKTLYIDLYAYGEWIGTFSITPTTIGWYNINVQYYDFDTLMFSTDSSTLGQITIGEITGS